MKTFYALLAGLAIILTSLLSAGPAYADHGSNNYMNALCNSDYSDASIRAYSTYPGATYSYTLGRGQCVSRPWNGADNLTVDVEPYSIPDIDSYKQGEINVGWAGCHENSENSSSDPSDHNNDNGTRYRNYSSWNCSTT